MNRDEPVQSYAIFCTRENHITGVHLGGQGAADQNIASWPNSWKHTGAGDPQPELAGRGETFESQMQD
ncbi:MAG TPA: hypothetical protein VK789_10655 [Bryobacteraceae bacterium]|jgi:hypothetical protein|nr:hypothetical protein [Bryobacteraceae bacterium]